MALAIEERVERRDEAGATPVGTFRIGSERHYPEIAPTHRAAVDGFFVDRMPVMNREFRRFVNATGRYRPAARHAEAVDTSTSRLGFRCIHRARSTR